MKNHEASWTLWQKISFRFLLPFLGLTTIFCWEVILIGVTHAALYKYPIDEHEFNKPLAGAFYWLDKHIFHTGFDPAIHKYIGGDSHFSVVFYLLILSVSLIAAVCWSFFDQKRNNYNKLFYWFSIYLRYTLAITMVTYGIIKLIPLQFPYPNIADMLKPFGEQTKFEVLWHFMGASPGYERFTGACEAIAGLLLLSRRTILAGILFTIAILTNVIALNWFYNVPVKIMPMQFLLYALFLIAPQAKILFMPFFMGTPAPISLKHFAFQTRWKKYLLKSIMIVVPVVLFLIMAIGLNKNLISQEADARKEKIYEVTSFVAKDTLPPLTADTLRWKRVLLFVYVNNMVIYDMKDQQHWYQFDVDSSKKTFILHDDPKMGDWKIFHYNYLSKDQLQLTGKWKGNDINATMQLMPIDSMNINKDRIRLIWD